MSTDRIKLLGKNTNAFKVMSLVAVKREGFAYKVQIRCGWCGNDVEHTRYPEGILADDCTWVDYWLAYISELQCPYCRQEKKPICERKNEIN